MTHASDRRPYNFIKPSGRHRFVLGIGGKNS